MRRARSVMLTFGVFCAMSMARAQRNGTLPTTPAPATASNIAVVNFNAAVFGTAEAQRSLSVLQKKYAPREEQMRKLSDDIEATKKSVNDAAAGLTDAERNQKLQNLGTKEKQLQREAEDYKNDSQAESQQAFQQVAQKLFSLLQEFSRQHGYAAVIERGTETAPVVWYTAGSVDITDQLIKTFDAKYGIEASPPVKFVPKHPLPSTGPNHP